MCGDQSVTGKRHVKHNLSFRASISMRCFALCSTCYLAAANGGCCRKCFQSGARFIRTGRSGASRVRECACLGRQYKNQVGMARKKQGATRCASWMRRASKTGTQPAKRDMTPPRKFQESSVILPLTRKALLTGWQ